MVEVGAQLVFTLVSASVRTDVVTNRSLPELRCSYCQREAQYRAVLSLARTDVEPGHEHRTRLWLCSIQIVCFVSWVAKDRLMLRTCCYHMQ
jgi:hypothetical protein